MLVDLETKEQGEWFTFRMSQIDINTGDIVWEEPIEGVEVQIRSAKPFYEGLYLKQERIIEWKINPKSKQYEKHDNPKEKTPDELVRDRDDSYDYAITGLKGWFDKKTKKPIECTRENKLALMNKEVFSRFFVHCQALLDSVGMEVETKETKNSLTGSSGKTTTPDSV
jgi:hypothetical protein